jgi:hypothetical protein
MSAGIKNPGSSSRESRQGVAVFEEAVEAVKRVKGLASREAGVSLDALAEVEDGGALLETNRKLDDGIGTNTLEFGDRGGDRRGSGNRVIPRQVHANQLDVCVRSRAEEMGRTGLQID